MPTSSQRLYRTGALVAAAATVATVGVFAPDGVSADVAPPELAAPAANVAAVGGAPDAAHASRGGAQRLAALDHQLEATVLADSVRTVAAPSGNGTWTIADTSAGGVCAALSGGLSFCESQPDELAAGEGGVDEYPADEILSVAEDGKSATVLPSTGSGIRHGFAPATATSVTVHVGAEEYARARVVDRMFTVRIPPQGTASTYSFGR